MVVADFTTLRIFVKVDNIVNLGVLTMLLVIDFVSYAHLSFGPFALLLSPLSSCPNHFCGEIRTAVVLALFIFSRVFVSHYINCL